MTLAMRTDRRTDAAPIIGWHQSFYLEQILNIIAIYSHGISFDQPCPMAQLGVVLSYRDSKTLTWTLNTILSLDSLRYTDYIESGQ